MLFIHVKITVIQENESLYIKVYNRAKNENVSEAIPIFQSI